MNPQEKEDLKREITHIFETGANEIRVFEMVTRFIDSRYLLHSKNNDDAHNHIGKQKFEVYYTNRKGEEGRVFVWVDDVDDVDAYFKKHYPHLELYDIGDCLN